MKRKFREQLSCTGHPPSQKGICCLNATVYPCGSILPPWGGDNRGKMVHQTGWCPRWWCWSRFAVVPLSLASNQSAESMILEELILGNCVCLFTFLFFCVVHTKPRSQSPIKVCGERVFRLFFIVSVFFFLSHERLCHTRMRAQLWLAGNVGAKTECVETQLKNLSGGRAVYVQNLLTKNSTQATPGPEKVRYKWIKMAIAWNAIDIRLASQLQQLLVEIAYCVPDTTFQLFGSLWQRELLADCMTVLYGRSG